MISASLKKLMAQMRRIIPDVNVTFIHFSTNSSSSQYRNTHMFNILLRRELLFAIKVAWNYFKACHGKGPCDRLAVTTKEMADNIIKHHKFAIQDAFDTAKKKSFLLRISSVNVPNPQFTEKIHNGKVHFLCSGISFLRMSLSRKNAII